MGVKSRIQRKEVNQFEPGGSEIEKKIQRYILSKHFNKPLLLPILMQLISWDKFARSLRETSRLATFCSSIYVCLPARVVEGTKQKHCPFFTVSNSD